MNRILTVLVLLLWFTPSAAQTKSSDREWQEALAGAKKEGKVVVVGSPDPVMRNEVIPKFTARYGVSVEFIAGRSSQTVARVQTERAAGIYNVDVYLSGPDTTRFPALPVSFLSMVMSSNLKRCARSRICSIPN